MIVVVGGIKGGSGKTTVATHLAILAATQGGDVLMIDADEQATASDFTVQRNEIQGNAGYTCIQLFGSAVRHETQQLASKYTHVIIDTGGRDTTSQRAALTVADLFVIPFVPRSFDVWTLDKVLELVNEIHTVNDDLSTYVFLNRADPRGSDNQEAASMLSDAAPLVFIDTPLGTRKAFGNAAAQGLSVTELRPQDIKASREVKTLFNHLFNIEK